MVTINCFFSRSRLHMFHSPSIVIKPGQHTTQYTKFQLDEHIERQTNQHPPNLVIAASN